MPREVKPSELQPHDVPMDLVVTPERTVRTETAHEKPTGTDWDVLGEDRLEATPVLRRLEGT